ncbi:outer membrane beta-barrel protein [Edaphobacter sp. 4G125]|nr:outer membrane beta-barrel protein [Edaphobacter sp. 4G125]
MSYAQAIPTATRNSGLQVGAGYSFASPDYGQRKIQGYSIYGTFDFTRHIGIEGDIHRVNVITPTDIGENTYLLGPRYVLHFGRFHPYAKGLLGLGFFPTNYDKGSGKPNTNYHHKIYAFGGGVDYTVSRHFNVRAVDFEYQRWPGWKPDGLTPYVFTFGAAYHF